MRRRTNIKSGIIRCPDEFSRLGDHLFVQLFDDIRVLPAGEPTGEALVVGGDEQDGWRNRECDVRPLITKTKRHVDRSIARQ